MRAHATLLAVALAALGASAQAADFHFTGNIVNTNDVIRVGFHLDTDTSNVRVWTDSYNSGGNFDPVVAVWNTTLGGSLVGENDDNPTIAPGQTRFDSGLTFASMTAGDYLFTIAVFPNFRNGSNLSNGFRFDADAPTAFQGGTFYSVNLSGVDAANVAAVPEPETYALMLAGLGAVAWGARRRRAA